MAVDWDALVLGPAMAIFGGVATYYAPDRLGQPGLTLTGAVFDEAFEAIILEDGQPVSSVMPALGVRDALFDTPPAQRGQVRIESRGLYVVRDVQPDGHGHTLLLLNLMQAD